MKIIDAHIHLVETIAGFGQRGELRAIGGGRARYADGTVLTLIPPELGEYQVTPESVLALMDRENVERAVILQGDYMGYQNEYALQAMRRYPERFMAAVTLDPYCRRRDGILHQLVEVEGAHVLKLEVSEMNGWMAAHDRIPLDAPTLQEIYAYAEAHGMVTVVDVGRPGSESYQLEALSRMIRRHSSMKWVICHLMMPLRDRLDDLAHDLETLAADNVWFDLAALPAVTAPGEAYPFPSAGRALRIARESVGAGRLIFGSDLPSTVCKAPYRELVGYAAEILTEEEREKVFYHNALHVFWNEE